MKTVFLIDDDLDDREIFQEALQSLNLTTRYVEAFDGLNALEKISENDFVIPDIIFADLNMPRLGGLEFLKKVRANPECKNVPVYIYSTSSAKEECDKCMAAGAAGFITKHYSFEDLEKELEKLIGNNPVFFP